jgi:hypothetical protein
MGYLRLTLREALASDRLEDFVRQEEARGVELANGSDLERAPCPANHTAPIRRSIIHGGA